MNGNDRYGLPPTDEEIEQGYQLWRSRYKVFNLDNLCEPFLSLKVPKESISWLKMAREAKLLSMRRAADTLGISVSSYCEMESREAKGSITIAQLAKAAEAIDCELVYAIRPKQRKSFSRLIWERILPRVLNNPCSRYCNPYRKAYSIANIANINTENSKFRDENGWLRNSRTPFRS